MEGASAQGGGLKAVTYKRGASLLFPPINQDVETWSWTRH